VRCKAGCGVDVADVRFYGTQSAIARSPRAFAKRVCETFNFYRIAQRCGRSVRFDVGDRIGVYSGYFQRFGDDRGLAAHALNRPKRAGHDGIPGERKHSQRDRRRDQKQGQQPVDRALAVAERCADNRDVAPRADVHGNGV